MSTGIQVLLELCKGTRQLAEERGFTQLAAQFDDAIRDAEMTPTKPAFARLSALQREALLCFRDGRDAENRT